MEDAEVDVLGMGRLERRDLEARRARRASDRAGHGESWRGAVAWTAGAGASRAAGVAAVTGVGARRPGVARLVGARREQALPHRRRYYPDDDPEENQSRDGAGDHAGCPLAET